MSTEKNFIVTNASDSNFIGKRFTIKTAITNEVELPFCESTYRVIMFDGMRIQLRNNEKTINGILA